MVYAASLYQKRRRLWSPGGLVGCYGLSLPGGRSRPSVIGIARTVTSAGAAAAARVRGPPRPRWVKLRAARRVAHGLAVGAVGARCAWRTVSGSNEPVDSDAYAGGPPARQRDRAGGPFPSDRRARSLGPSPVHPVRQRPSQADCPVGVRGRPSGRRSRRTRPSAGQHGGAGVPRRRLAVATVAGQTRTYAPSLAPGRSTGVPRAYRDSAPGPPGVTKSADLTSGKRVLSHDEDGRPFVSGAYQARSCSDRCRNRALKRAYRERHRDCEVAADVERTSA